MTQLLYENLDYILFVYGVGLAFLAMVLLGFSDTVDSPLPWRWMGFSAALLAGSALTQLLLYSLGDRTPIEVIHVGLFVAGSFCLLEFARRTCVFVTGTRIGRWVVLALVSLTALSAVAGLGALEVVAGYLLGAVGAVWAAVALWRFARRGGAHGRSLLVAAVCLLGFAACEFVVVRHGSIPLVTRLNEEWFLSTVGIPVQILSIAFAVPFVVALWSYHRGLLRDEHPGLAGRRGLLFEVTVFVGLFAILVGGYVAASRAGAGAEEAARSSLRKRTALAAAAINPERVARLTATRVDGGTPDYDRLRAQLVLMADASPDVRWFYVMVLRNDFVWFMVDGVPVDDPGHAAPGTLYEEPPSELKGVFSGGRALTVEPYTDEYGTFVSGFAPITDPGTGRVVGVLGLDVDVSTWVATVAEHRLEPILIALLLALIVLGFYVVQERRQLDSLTLAESEREYRTVLESMEDVFYRTDMAGDLVMASPSFAQLFGYDSVDEALGLNLGRDLYVDSAQREELLQRIEKDGSVLDYEVDVRRRDGSVLRGSTTSHQYIDASGTVKGVEGVLRDITERKRAEQTVAQAEERSRLLLQSAGDGIFGVDPDGHVTFMNAAAEELLGWAAEELHGLGMHEATHYAFPDGSFYPLDDCPQHAAYTKGLECRVDDEVMWRKDGTSFPAEYMARPLWQDGVVSGAIITFRDISERRAVEEALRESRDRLDYVLTSAQVGAWACDLATEHTHWDETVAVLYGMDPHALEGPFSSFDATVDPDDLARMNEAIERTVQTDVPYEMEFRVIRPDGTVAYLAERGRVRRDESGRPLTLSGLTWDDTERRMAEEDLRFTRFVVEQAADVVFWLTAEGDFVYGNRAARETLGYDADELARLSIHDVDPDFPAERWPQHMAELAEAGSLTLETRHRRKDGVLIPVEVTAMCLEFGGQTFNVAFARDISERRAAEEAVRKAKERTDSANRDLEHAIARANRLAMEAGAANSAKSEFLANMSHEIRTPMNGVIGMTSLLLDTELDAEQNECARTVQDSAEALLVIINDILDFSKIEAGKLDMEILDFDLRAAIEDTCDLPALQAQDKGLELTALVEADVPSALRGDPGRLRQVLTNLLSNAVKFTETGDITVTVSLAEETETGATLRFAVADSGIGIAEEKREALFEAFTQADASTTRRFGGTGLGLAISRQLVGLMGGQIGVESEPGQGSEFWFTAVFARQDAETTAALDMVTPTDVRGTRILAVDDNSVNRRVVAGMLEAWGCRHREVDGAEAALAELRAAHDAGDPYEVAILDMMMPGMDGEELGGVIKADPEIAAVSLVMMTSMGSRGDAGRLERRGFAAYLTKPVKQSQLYDCLMVVINRGEAHDRPSAAPIVTRHSLVDRDKRRVRILLAEDNAINQKVALKILQRMGYAADAVADGQAALEALAAHPYDLVLMDVQMPRMDGMTATRRIRAADSEVLDHGVPIIALTAHAMAEDRDACLAAGMNDYLSKPIQPDKLAAAIAHWAVSVRRDDREPAIGGAGRGRTVAQATGAAEIVAATASSADDAPPVFDVEVLNELLAGDRESVDEIVDAFRADVPRQVAALEEALAGADADAVRRQAHTIKGASANVGAEALRAAALTVETAASAGDLAAAREHAVAVVAELERLLEALGEERA